MDITRFLDKPNTPVPIPRDASLMQEKCIIAGNLAMQELSVKKKERQRVTLQPRIKWTAQERFELGRLACQTSTANALKQAKIAHPLANEATIRNFRKAAFSGRFLIVFGGTIPLMVLYELKLWSIFQ